MEDQQILNENVSENWKKRIAGNNHSLSLTYIFIKGMSFSFNFAYSFPFSVSQNKKEPEGIETLSNFRFLFLLIKINLMFEWPAVCWLKSDYISWLGKYHFFNSRLTEFSRLFNLKVQQEYHFHYHFLLHLPSLCLVKSGNVKNDRDWDWEWKPNPRYNHVNLFWSYFINNLWFVSPCFP